MTTGFSSVYSARINVELLSDCLCNLPMRLQLLNVFVTTVTAASTIWYEIDQLLSDKRLKGALVGVIIADVETGSILYEHASQTRLLPASNQKILTSTVALDVLGPDYKFKTTVASDGEVRNGTLNGNIYLKGGGDPTLLATDCVNLAKKISATGIERIRGSVIADDSWFDSQRLGDGWEWNDESYYYGAQISALTVSPDTDYDAGSVIVSVSPGNIGESPMISLNPQTDYVKLVNEAVTVNQETEDDDPITIERDHGSNTVRVQGSISHGSMPVQEWIAVWNPTYYALNIFEKALKQENIEFVSSPMISKMPENATELISHESIPLSALLIPFLKLSNNGHAEILAKSIGREVVGHGTWRAGLSTIAKHIGKRGVDVETVRIVDGSGLSTGNLISPESITRLLLAVRNASWFNNWYDALPVAGDSRRFVGGTLSNRMVNTIAANNVHAKTGSLNGVSTISGYLTDAGGRDVVFSMMFNNYIGKAPNDLQDAIILRLCQMIQ